MIYELYDDLLYTIITFLNEGETYILFETSKQFNNVIKNKKYSILKKIPTIKNILSSKTLTRWAFKKKDFKMNDNYTYHASELNNFKMLKYLYKKGFKIHKFCSLCSIENNNIKMFLWVYKKTQAIDKNIFKYAINKKNIILIKWLIKNDYFPTYNDINIACLVGDLNIVKILLDTGVFWNSDAYDYTCISGNLKILKYLFEISHNDLSKPWWTASCCAIAAEYNKLHILKYLKKKGCPWDERTTRNALTNNNIEILKWALQNNCPINQDLIIVVQEMFNF